MKQLITPDKVQKEMLTDFIIMGETRGLIGGYCENEFPVYYANEEMARMLGYDAVEEMVEAIDGKVIHTIHPDDREQVIKDIGGEYYEGLTYETTYRMPRKDGFWFWTRNIDSLIKKERMQEEKLKKAYAAAENANKVKTEFLNNMSHDIRTPMNVVLGYNQLMKSLLTEPKQLDYQKKMEQSGKLLLSIINNVLDMARIESGKMKVDENYERVGEVVDEIISTFASEAEEKGMDILQNPLILRKWERSFFLY